MNEEQKRLTALFSFIKAMVEQKQKIITRIQDQPWSRYLSDFPMYEDNVIIDNRNRADAEEEDNRSTALITVKNPDFESCPKPDTIINHWLSSGWQDYKLDAQYMEKKLTSTAVQPYTEDDYESFEENDQRVKSFKKWKTAREDWASKQKTIAKVRELFNELFNLKISLDRESESIELMIGNGILKHQRGLIEHPILLRKVNVVYDKEKNEILITDTNAESELHSILVTKIPTYTSSSIKDFQAELTEEDYHPYDNNAAPKYLTKFVQSLSSNGRYFTHEPETQEVINPNEAIILYNKPVIFLRKKLDGTVRAIERIIEDLTTEKSPPPFLVNFVMGGELQVQQIDEEETIDKLIAATGGEDTDILLTKEANREQLDIAKRLNKYNAVLVQGPPGTGKTHTIANLIGHYLSQGKSMLVTSHTKKALSVLKDKIVPELRPLCVSIIDDTNLDMERSIDGITANMSNYTADQLKRESDTSRKNRQRVIDDLNKTRLKIYSRKHEDLQTLVINGESVSPIDAAKFVYDNRDTLSFLPGEITRNAPFPVSMEDLRFLYQSNESLSDKEEYILLNNPPEPSTIMEPLVFETHLSQRDEAFNRYTSLLSKTEFSPTFNKTSQELILDTDNIEDHLEIQLHKLTELKNLNDFLKNLGSIPRWAIQIISDSKRGNSRIGLWTSLVEVLEKTYAKSEAFVSERLGKEITLPNTAVAIAGKKVLTELGVLLVNPGFINKIRMNSKSFSDAKKLVLINGMPIETAEQCELAINYIELIELRLKSKDVWDNLLSIHDCPLYNDLDTQEPESAAYRWLSDIKKYLSWYEKDFPVLCNLLNDASIDFSRIFSRGALKSEYEHFNEGFAFIKQKLMPALELAFTYHEYLFHQNVIEHSIASTQKHSKQIQLLETLITAMEGSNGQQYGQAYLDYLALYNKTEATQKRQQILDKIVNDAPEWASEIRNRAGIHGSALVPERIQDAWKWKLYKAEIEYLNKQPYTELLIENQKLSLQYRVLTAKLADKSAWYHLLNRTETDIDMKHALIGWRQTVRKIGKGTGKNAPKYKSEARKLMAKCQEAVPCWIMPISKAIDTLNPQFNKFDIMIIDEASQSDLSALPVTYMARKLIIVGDDKQVSPLAVGQNLDIENQLAETYLKDIIPNWHLYGSKTSLYDLASTTFPPLMLREHFRCVPEIIGFSNKLSYDYKIKPLRASQSSSLKPAVVVHRVPNGQRVEKTTTNPAEAQTIAAMVRACLELPEYANKTFGVISMLGDKQHEDIERQLLSAISPTTYLDRRILCGTPAHFQGDERDVIFFSMVDSNDGMGPLRTMGPGTEESNKKRLNVAASRARDQLWIIHSLDPSNDLTSTDLRKELFDYASNPQAHLERVEEVNRNSESPFEAEVASALLARGYNIVQQWKVGSYRIDMVVSYQNKKIALECDGDAYHSGEEKIRYDMERQTILERIGWKFIRIRGTEYYRNPENTLDKITSALEQEGILPETVMCSGNDSSQNMELINKVKRHAMKYFDNESSIPSDLIDLPLETEQNHASMHIGKNLAYPNLEEGTERQIVKLTGQSYEDSNFSNIAPLQTKLPVLETKKKSVIKHRIIKKLTDVRKSNVIEPVLITIENQGELKQKKEYKPVNEIQIPLLSATAANNNKTQSNESLVSELIRLGLKYIDNRSKKGSLWVIGGKDLDNQMSKFRKRGIYFTFKLGGGQATKGKDAWWTKSEL